MVITNSSKIKWLANKSDTGLDNDTNIGYIIEPTIVFLLTSKPKNMKLIINNTKVATYIKAVGLKTSFSITERPVVPPITKSFGKKNKLYVKANRKTPNTNNISFKIIFLSISRQIQLYNYN